LMPLQRYQHKAPKFHWMEQIWELYPWRYTTRTAFWIH